ncbi:P-loop NTPase fold protein [Paractinoplanes lichenicola]|uniref:AAA family ATPase n=1 Tax=Paractinoplanes lichenicola TaxID=2802976 RepID=A0ABS1W3N2_9ACTN|nr:P-loop NTPase fold protein [Actinoplanes lichenicola]MBL7261351.1 AAA family ATPase [Actinoplanes lichenicola]
MAGLDGWWADDPIESAADEALGRGPFVKRFAEMLDLVGGQQSSSVVALVGPWGSGKTSTANLVIACLDSAAWGGIGRLTPWALSTPDAIVGELLGAIAGALPQDRKATRALRRIKDYARTYAVPALSLVPTVGSVVEKIGEQVLAADDTTLLARFEQVREALADLARPVLVFVDDVDRLQPEELLTLFRAIRVVGRLPYVHYFIAYDQRTVIDLLKATPVASDREDRALAFLEKVVTLPIDQPALREVQSADLFNAGLTALLHDLGISLAEEQRRRLNVDWEGLLAADLAEPRGIRRLLAQLRVHLPLAGVHDVDVADFVAMTHLRLAYPRLFQALRTDRVPLASGGPRAEARLKQWQKVTALTDLAVAENRSEAVWATLRRLFPVLADGQDVSPRHRGVDNPDYATRYFAFVPEDAEPSDAELIEWFKPPVIEKVLRPDRSDRQAVSRSAGMIRRLANVAAQLGASQAANLLDRILPYLPLPADSHQLFGGPDAAMNRLLTTLLKKIPSADFNSAVQGAATAGIDVLATLVEAVESGSRFANEAGNRAWAAFINNVQEGDRAPLGPTSILFAQADRLLGSTEVNRRLARTVDDKTDLGALASRLVERGYGTDGAPEIVGFDAEALIERLGPRRFSQHVPQPQPLPTSTGANDWESYRFHAVVELNEALPHAVVQVPRQMASHRVEVLSAPNGEVPDFKISATVLVPAGEEFPTGIAIAPGPTDRDREDLIQQQLAECALTRWLRREPELRWPFRFDAWQLTDVGDGMRHTRLGTRLHDTSGAGGGWRQQTPVLAGVNVRTGTTGEEGYLVADFAVGLWLTELDGSRRPAGRRHDARPLPAALDPGELHELLDAMTLTALDVSTALYQGLLRRRRPDPDMIVHVVAEANNGLDSVVDFTGLNRPGAGTGSGQHADDLIFRPSREDSAPIARDWTNKFLRDWLVRAGYRDYDVNLMKASPSKA